MSVLAKKYWMPFLFCSLVGIMAFYISYRSSKNYLIEQTTRTIQAVTNVKLHLLERKLSSLEQQLGLLSKKEVVYSLLTSSTSKSNVQFDEYAKGLLFNQGFSSMLLIRQSGEVAYINNQNPDRTDVPGEIYDFVKQGMDSPDSALVSRIIVNRNEPYPFYYGKRIADAKGTLLGALFIEIPKEFLSIELHNTISLDSLHSYLVSSQGTMDQRGRLNPGECTICSSDNDEFILVSPAGKIRGTWTLYSSYPISQLAVQGIVYASVLDGLLAFAVTGIIGLIVTYSIQLFQRSKGVTNSDILLVQTTWNEVSEFSTAIIAGFYKYLFESAPEVKPMFRSTESVQQQRMALMINTIVNSADSLDEFKGSISQLAKKHTQMGVKKEYFPIVVKALVSSVEDQFGSGFTSAHRKAWYKILNRISAIMIAEMESKRASPSPSNISQGI